MLSYQKTINFSGTSSVEVDGKKVPIVYLNTSIQPDGKSNLNYSVHDKELFAANPDVFAADREEFGSEVKASI